MNSRCLTFLAGLLAVFSLVGAHSAHACKYCWSGENAEAADYARQAMQAPSAPSQTAGAFPLDATISQFQPVAPTAASTPVTNAADLRAARVAATNTTPAPVFAPKVTAEFAPRRSAPHYADAGLLGLAAAGGVFCWRTRRQTGTVR